MSESITERLAHLSTALLCDALDSLGFREAALGPEIHALDIELEVTGRAFTMRCEPAESIPDEPYVHLIDAFAHVGTGDVIVIETADRVSAMWGELLSTAAMARDARGAVMDGLTRDVDDITEIGFPVWASGVSPLDSAGRQDVVEHGTEIRCGLAPVAPGDWIRADRMGVIVVPAALAEDAATLAEGKLAGEAAVRADLAAGQPLGEVFGRHGIL